MNAFADDNTNRAQWGERIRIFIRGKEQYLLALLLFFAATTAGVVLHHSDKYSLYYFGDAASHIIKAREFTDSQPHEIPIVGTVWLPLPHFLLLPFASIDNLFFSGIAGSFIGIPCLVGTGVLLFLILRSITGSVPVAFLMASLYGLNPNVVYISLTPMDEPTLIFFVALAGYALYRWLTTESALWLFSCAAAVMLATLCRYEAWLLAPLVLFTGTLKALPQWRESQRGKAIGTVAIAIISFAGIALWLSWHAIAFGNPFKFTMGTYSVLSTVYRGSEEHLPFNILVTFSRAIFIIFGPALLIIATAAFVPLRRRDAHRKTILLLVFFILPMLFTLAAAFAGYIGVDEWWWNWRYVLTFGLFLAVAGGTGLLEIVNRMPAAWGRSIVVGALLATPLVQLATPSIGVVVYKDAAKCIDATVRDAITVGEHLPGVCKSGSIGFIIDENYIIRIEIASGLPLKRFRIIHFSAGQKIPDSTLRSEQYLVVQKNQPLASQLPASSSPGGNTALLENFRLRFESTCFALLERKPATGSINHPTSDSNPSYR